MDTAQLLDVENNFAFLPHRRAFEGAKNSPYNVTPLLTFCNCYAAVFCAARGARLPADLANRQMLWLASTEGQAEGWRLVTRDEALELVNAGELVVAVAESDGHGHIGVLVESFPSDPDDLFVSSAGAHNHKRVLVEQSFGFLKPLFFHHRRKE